MENHSIKKVRPKRALENDLPSWIKLQFKAVLESLSTIEEYYKTCESFDEIFDDFMKDYFFVKNSHESIRTPASSDFKVQQVPPKIMRRPYFDLASTVSSVGDWSKYSRVSYALQYKNGSSYSTIGPWSKPLVINYKFCPILGVPVAPHYMTRIVYRKFDDEEAQIISVLDNETQRFRDVDRDIYNAASNPDENEAMNELDFLLGINGNVSAVFEHGWKPIHAAAKNGNLKIAKTFLSNDYHAKDDDGYTPLHFAVESDYDGFIEIFKDDVNSKTNLGLTPLHIAAYKGYKLTMEKLIMNGANVTIQDNHGLTPLHHGIFNGFLFDSLLDKKSDTEWRRALHFALINNDVDLIKKSIEKNANINIETPGAFNLLHLATMFGDENMVELLKENSIELNAKAVYDWTPLHFAVALRKSNIVSSIANSTGVDINANGGGNVTPLHLAVITDQEDTVKILLDNLDRFALWQSQDAKTNEGLTPLHIAIKRGNQNMMSLLIDNGANIAAKTSEGHTSFFLTDDIELQKFLAKKAGKPYELYAAQMGRLDVVKKYVETVESRIEDFTRDGKGNTLLHYAALGGHFDVVNYLCDRYENLADQRNNEGKYPFHLAARNGDVDIFKRLTDYFNSNGDSAIFKEDNYGNTALHYAVQNEHISVLKHIIQLIKDRYDSENFRQCLNKPNKSAETPLSAAFRIIFPRNDDAILYLASIDPPATGSNGETALHLAAKYGRSYIAKSLVEGINNIDQSLAGIDLIGQFPEGQPLKGIDLNVKDSNGKTPLSYALENEDLDLARYLIEKGAKFDELVYSPLHIAIKEGNLNMVKFLVQKKVDIEKRDGNGKTPLHEAVRHGSLDMVKYLVQKGAQVNVMDGEDKTPVHLAAEGDNEEILRYFAEDTNADMIAVDKQNRTPLQLAIANNMAKAVHYLSEIKRQRRSLPFEQFAMLKKTPDVDLPLISHSKSNIKHQSSQITHDTNGTLLLFDVVIRKLTGRKYVCDAEPMPLAEAQACALNIAEEFENIMKASGSKNLDFYKIYREIASKVVGCKFDEISPLLISYANSSGVKSEEFKRFMAKLGGGKSQNKLEGNNLRCWLKFKKSNE